MRIKPMLPLMAALCIALSSCSFAEDGNTHSSDEITLTPAADIYSGADDVINSPHSAFKFADGVTVSGSADINKLIMTYKKDSEKDYYSRGEAICKAAFGDSFDKDLCSIVYSDDNKDEILRFEYKNGGEWAEYCYDNSFMYELYDGAGSVNFQNDEGESLLENVKVLRADDDLSGTLTLKNGNTTFDSYKNVISGTANNSLSVFTAPLKAEPDTFIAYDAYGQKSIYTHLHFSYCGVPVDYTFTGDIKNRDNELNGLMSYFMPLDMWTVSCSPDRADAYVARNIQRFVSSEKIDSLISFKDAAAILDRELAQNSRYTFVKCELALCSVHTQKEELTPDEFDMQYDIPVEYTPYWIFYIEQDDGDITDLVSANVYSSVRVNALTGEIYVLLMNGEM